MFCHQCGFNFADDQASCPSCQTPATRTNPWVEAFPSEGDALPSNPWASLSTPEAPAPPAPPAAPAPLPPLPVMPAQETTPPPGSSGAPESSNKPSTPVWDDQIPAFDTQEGLLRFEEIYGGTAPSLSTPAKPTPPETALPPSQSPGAYDQFFTPVGDPLGTATPAPTSPPPVAYPPQSPPPMQTQTMPTSPPSQVPYGALNMEGAPGPLTPPPVANPMPPIPEGYGASPSPIPAAPVSPVTEPSMLDQLIAEASPAPGAGWAPPAQPQPPQPIPAPTPGAPSVLDQIIAETGSHTLPPIVTGAPGASTQDAEPSLLEKMLGLPPTDNGDVATSASMATSSETPRLDALMGGQVPLAGEPLPPSMAMPPGVPGAPVIPEVQPAPPTSPPLDATASMPAPVFDQPVAPAPTGPPITLPDSFFRNDQTGAEDGYIPAPGSAGDTPGTPPSPDAPALSGILSGPVGQIQRATDAPTDVASTDLVPAEDQDPSAVIVEGRTPVELASNTVKRDRTTLRIVVLMVIGMILVGVAATLLLLLT